MTRALWTFLGRGFLVLALSGAAVACGDDDDDDDAVADAGAGKGGSGGKGGTGGKGGSGGAGGTVSKEMCVTNTTKAAKDAPIAAACIECGCGANAAVVNSCNAACWEVIQCSTEKCADKLGNPETATACVVAMCSELLGATGAATAAMIGPVLTGTTCAAKCAPPAPPPDNEGDAGVDAGH